MGSPDDDHEIGRRHAALGQDGAPGGARDAEIGAVDEGGVEDGVGYEARDGDIERGPGVLEAAQDSGGGEDDEHGRYAEGGDP